MILPTRLTCFGERWVGGVSFLVAEPETNIVRQAGTTGYADTNARSAGPFFYQVGVQAP